MELSSLPAGELPIFQIQIIDFQCNFLAKQAAAMQNCTHTHIHIHIHRAKHFSTTTKRAMRPAITQFKDTEILWPFATAMALEICTLIVDVAVVAEVEDNG